MKPASPTPSNTWSTRSFQDTEWKVNRSRILPGSAVRRRISIPMCGQSTTCNPNWHIRSGRAQLRGCIRLHMILYSKHSIATGRWWAMSHSNTPPVRKWAPLTAQSSSLRCVSAAKYHTGEQYSKTDRTLNLEWFFKIKCDHKSIDTVLFTFHMCFLIDFSNTCINNV